MLFFIGISHLAATVVVTAAAPSGFIFGGGPSDVCQWPTTVDLGGCTGTLIAPTIVVYAAHCGIADAIGFGEQKAAPARRGDIEYCRTFPEYDGGGGGNDFAFCKLRTPVTDVPIVPVLMGCELAALKGGKPIVFAGFGRTEQGTSPVKRHVSSVHVRIDGRESFDGGDGKDTCNGDSGGPAYVRLEASDGLPGTVDGSWRVYGITSYGTGECGEGGYSSMIHLAVPWIERESGVDVSPCHDANGTWNPGPACGGFPLDPAAPGGNWAAGCQSPKGGFSATCGPPYAPAQVTFLAPAEGATLAADARLMVEVQAAGVNGAAPAAVVVTVDDGSPLELQTSTPPKYTFGGASLSPGEHSLVATVTDVAGTSARATATVLVVATAEPISVLTTSAAVFSETRAAGCAATPIDMGWIWGVALWRLCSSLASRRNVRAMVKRGKGAP